MKNSEPLLLLVILMVILNSCQGGIFQKSLPYPQTTVTGPAAIYSGPGNTTYPEVGNLQPGDKVYLLGQYVNFIKIQPFYSDIQGFVLRDLLSQIPPDMPVISADNVPMEWHDLVMENCMGPWTEIDENDLAVMKSPGLPDGESFGIQGRVTSLTDKTILRLNLSTTSTGMGSIRIQDSPTNINRPESSHRALEILIVDHAYKIRFQDGINPWAHDVDLPLPEGKLLIVELIGNTAGQVRISDAAGNILVDLNIKNIPAFTQLDPSVLASGLFPDKQMSIGCAVNTPSDFIFRQRDIEKQPEGKWEELAVNLEPGLQELAAQYRIDMMMPMENWMGDHHYYEIYKRDFGTDLLVNTNAPFFWTDIGKYNFKFMDRIIDYDISQGWKAVFTLHNYTGVLPESLINSSFSRQEYIDILHEYVSTVVSHYKEKVYLWIIAPEAISFDRDKGDKSVDFWADKIGLDYIEMMFRWAHQADPNGKLMWTDAVYASSGIENFDEIYSRMLTMLKDFKERGVPIDAVGIGGSYFIFDWWNIEPNKDHMIQTMLDFAQYGVEIYLPETEVSVAYMEGTREEKWAYQAQVYKMIMDACIESGVCRGIGIFQIRDSDSWLNCPDGDNSINSCPLQPPPEPLLFDDNFTPKPAYFALIESFKSHK